MDNQKLNVEEILGNEVVTTQEIEGVENQELDDEIDTLGNQLNNKFNDTYVHIYSGKAMNERELLSFSARNKTNLILVAGPFASGKTTLMVMMYYLFREGHNKKLQFKSSCTIKGYLERSRSLLLNSGNSIPDTERTPIKAEDLFLNLNLVSEDGKNSDLVFADLSGEIFKSQDYLKEVPECCAYTKNVLLILDGEKMGNISTRRSAFHDLILMIENLIKNKYLTKNTNVQIICTKMDWNINKAADGTNIKELEKYIDTRIDEIKTKYQNKFACMKFYKISALNLDLECESEKLEQIILNCFEADYIEIEKKDKPEIKLNRAFEHFGLRK